MNYKIKTLCRDRAGMTFIELLVVIAIIGLLSSLSMVGYGEIKKRANIAKAQHFLDQINRAATALASETGLWPGGQPAGEVCTDPLICGGNEICPDGCAFGISDPESGLMATDGSYPFWAGPYISMIVPDPWGNEYFFDTDYDVGGVTMAVIGSYGPNGTGNNNYDSDDIIIIIAR